MGTTFVAIFCGEGNGNHSSTLAWKIPWTEEPGKLQSMGSQRVRHGKLYPWCARFQAMDLISASILYMVSRLNASQWEGILLPVQEILDTQVQFLVRENPLKEEMEIHSSFLA